MLKYTAFLGKMQDFVYEVELKEEDLLLPITYMMVIYLLLLFSCLYQGSEEMVYKSFQSMLDFLHFCMSFQYLSQFWIIHLQRKDSSLSNACILSTLLPEESFSHCYIFLWSWHPLAKIAQGTMRYFHLIFPLIFCIASSLPKISGY